jgi:hypothetical protein
LVLSSESLGNIVEKNRKGFQNFDRYLCELSKNVSYIAYVRDPVDRFPSLTSQALMRIATVPSFERAMNVADMRALKELFGERFNVRVYDRGNFPARDVIADFVSAVIDCAPLLPELERAAESNPSLSAEGMYIVQTIALLHQMRNPENFPNHSDEMHEIARFVRVSCSSILTRSSAKVHDHIALAIRAACATNIDNMNQLFGIEFKKNDENHVLEPNRPSMRSQLVRSNLKVDLNQVELEINHLLSLKRTPENLRKVLGAFA